MALPFTYHWRNLFVRKTTTLLTVLVIAAVVGTLTWVLGFGAALTSSLAVAGDEQTIIVIRHGANSEGASAVPVADFNKLNQLADLARDPASDQPLLSPEMLVQVSLPRLRDRGRTSANVAVRGVTDAAFRVHRTVRLSGRTFSTGAPDVIVGIRAAQQFAGLQIGDTLNLGFSDNRVYKVVGFFTAGGGPLESEIWGDLPSLLSAYNRTMYSAASLRIRDGAAPATVIKEIEGPAIDLSAQTEKDYWSGQTSQVRIYLAIVGALVLVMAAAAAFSIANTMFAHVAGRMREIAMLRTIGFGRRQILLGFLLEAVLLALLGGGVGCLACALWLEVIGHTKDMYGSGTFTTLAFDIRLTPAIVGLALAAVALVGAIGALVPAWRAARVQVIAALREG